MSQKKQWRDLPAATRARTVGLALVQIGLTIAALRDLRRRPQSEINGRKGLWTAAAFVNFIGPLAYFAFGRRSAALQSASAPETGGG